MYNNWHYILFFINFMIILYLYYNIDQYFYCNKDIIIINSHKSCMLFFYYTYMYDVLSFLNTCIVWMRSLYIYTQHMQFWRVYFNKTNKRQLVWNCVIKCVCLYLLFEILVNPYPILYLFINIEIYISMYNIYYIDPGRISLTAHALNCIIWRRYTMFDM